MKGAFNFKNTISGQSRENYLKRRPMVRPRKSFDARSSSMVCRKCSSGFGTSLASPRHSDCKLQQTGFTQTFFANLLMGGCLRSSIKGSICMTVSMPRKSEWSVRCGLPGATGDVCLRCRPRETFQDLLGLFNLSQDSVDCDCGCSLHIQRGEERIALAGLVFAPTPSLYSTA